MIWAQTDQRKQSFGWMDIFFFHSDESEPQDQSHSSAQAFLFITLLKRISIWGALFSAPPPSAFFFSSHFLIPLFCPLSSRVVLFSAREGCRLHSGRTTCPPVHQTHPRRASGLNSKLKTHYQAISPGIMLSNDLISLSVSPVSHQRPRQLGRLCPRVPGALRCSRRRRHRCRANRLSLSSSKTG